LSVDLPSVHAMHIVQHFPQSDKDDHESYHRLQRGRVYKKLPSDLLQSLNFLGAHFLAQRVAPPQKNVLKLCRSALVVNAEG